MENVKLNYIPKVQAILSMKIFITLREIQLGQTIALCAKKLSFATKRV